MNARLVNSAAGVVQAAMEEGRQTAAGIALALDSAQLLQSPETAAEMTSLRARVAELADVPPVPVDPGPQGDDERAKVAELIGDAKPATGGLLVHLAKSVRDRLAHDHSTQREDWYCMNLTSFMGERMGPVLRRLVNAEARAAELDFSLRTARTDLADSHDDLERALGRDGAGLEWGDLISIAASGVRAEQRVAELEAAPTTVYRAEHPDSGITLGHYGTSAAARAHCEATERRSWPTGTTLAFDWIEDDEDRVAELVVTAGQNEESVTGYIVTALELDSEYDAGADE